MKKYIFIMIALPICSTLYAQSQHYTIQSGGGVDDIALGLKNAKGKEFWAYCQDQCGNWFQYNAQDQVEQLNPRYKGKKVIADLSLEKNKGRIVGPGEEGKLYFIKKIMLLK